MTVERRDVTFRTGESFVAGWFFLAISPPGARVPAVALAPAAGARRAFKAYRQPTTALGNHPVRMMFARGDGRILTESNSRHTRRNEPQPTTTGRDCTRRRT